MTPLQMIDSRPSFTVKLPSTGKDITFKPYVTKQEKLLLMAGEAGDIDSMISAVEKLIDECTEGVDVKKMTTFDGEFLFSQIRAKSAGEVEELTIACQSCEKPNAYEYRFDAPFTVKLEKPPKVEVTETASIQLRWPLFSDLRTVSIIESNTQQLYTMMERVIESVGNDEELIAFDDCTAEQRTEFVENLPGTVSREIQKFLGSIPSYSNDIEFDCGACGHHNKHAAKGIAGFFS